MGLIAKTLTRGFRTSYFRNQPVHQFYGHLQAVLKDIDSSGQMNSLFARPASSAANEGEMEWSTDLNGNPVSFKDLSPEKQQEIAGVLSSSIEKIKNYADSKQGKTGIEKDYADYLKAVAMSPDLNQVFVINNRPVLVHWGFSCDSGNHPGQGIYAGWDEFITQVQRKAAPKSAPKPQDKSDQAAAAAAAAAVFAAPPPEAEPVIEKQSEKIVEKAAEKPVEKKHESQAKEAAPKPEAEKNPGNKANDPNREKPVMALGLGIYKWVKWLAIVLAIIILLLLLLKFLLPRNPKGGMGGMPMGGGMPSLQDILGGGMPGGEMPAGGGAPDGSGGSGQGQGQKAPKICPHCGHPIDESGSHGQARTTEKNMPQSPQPSNPPQAGQTGN